MTELAGVRDGVEAPHEIAGADVDGADVAGSGRESLGGSMPEDQKVFEDDAGCIGADEQIPCALSQPDVKIGREELLARPRVDGEERLARGEEDPTLPRRPRRD